MTWQAFIARYGAFVRDVDLAAIVAQPVRAIRSARARGGTGQRTHRSYVELFTLWHGRPPRDDEWPKPLKLRRTYVWQQPERTLLVTLVGRMGVVEISRILTERLRRVTGDPDAERNKNAVQTQINQLGMQAGDVVGGITIADAAREIGARAKLHHDIRIGKLESFRVGRLHVIPHKAFAAWKAKRTFPPKGFVMLRELKVPLGIKSDKLSEFARAGLMPTAVRCNPYGTKGPSTQFGTWWVDRKVVRKIIADRRAGRAMPWHGQPNLDNLKVTWRLWKTRQHPAHCQNCRDIWGAAGPPATFDDYVQRYPPLAHGAKRHLTHPFSNGLTAADVAADAGVPVATVHYAIRNGALRVTHKIGQVRFISRTDATLWKYRKCPTGRAIKSMLAIPTAAKAYGFTVDEIERHIERGALTLHVGTVGAQNRIRYVQKNQIRLLRDRIGYTERAAARRCRVTVSRLRVLLRGLEWRQAERIPAEVIANVIKRKYSRHGVTFTEAARALGKSVAWVRQQMYAGTFRVLRTKWNKQRRYVSAPQLQRLRQALRQGPARTRPNHAWCRLSEAADLAGVSTSTLQRWHELQRLPARTWKDGTYFHRRSVMAHARKYWKTARFKRTDRRPEWLQEPAA